MHDKATSGCSLLHKGSHVWRSSWWTSEGLVPPSQNRTGNRWLVGWTCKTANSSKITNNNLTWPCTAVADLYSIRGGEGGGGCWQKTKKSVTVKCELCNWWISVYVDCNTCEIFDNLPMQIAVLPKTGWMQLPTWPHSTTLTADCNIYGRFCWVSAISFCSYGRNKVR